MSIVVNAKLNEEETEDREDEEESGMTLFPRPMKGEFEPLSSEPPIEVPFKELVLGELEIPVHHDTKSTVRRARSLEAPTPGPSFSSSLRSRSLASSDVNST